MTHLTFIQWSFALLLLAPSGRSLAQAIIADKAIAYPLQDGETLKIVPSAEDPHRYYCLPAQLRVSVNEERQPEFLLMLWASEGVEKVDNGILHWLFTWGLTKEQDQAVDDFLKKEVDSLAVFAGSVLTAAPEKYTLKGSNTALIQLLERSLTSGGGIPTNTGGKSATSFKIKGKDAQKILEIARKPDAWKGVVVEMPFSGLSGEFQHTLQLDIGAAMQTIAACATCYIIPE